VRHLKQRDLLVCTGRACSLVSCVSGGDGLLSVGMDSCCVCSFSSKAVEEPVVEGGGEIESVQVEVLLGGVETLFDVASWFLDSSLKHLEHILPVMGLPKKPQFFTREVGSQLVVVVCCLPSVLFR